jgi:predicted RNA-binding Zn ribbon-like protein
MSESTAATLRLVGGDPCLDFVNTVGGRTAGAVLPRAEKLAGYLDIVAWARHASLLDEGQASRLARGASQKPGEASQVFARAIRLREALYGALTRQMAGRSPLPVDLETLNAELGAARRRERLAWAARGLRWESASEAGRLDAVLGPVIRAAAALLTTGDLTRLRQCGGERCGWLFLDHSRNHSRHWCSMADCGNLTKVRRFRERRKRTTARPASRGTRPSN